MSSTELGVVREIWLAPGDDISDKHSFLVRDDAYAVSEATFGRQVRLGQPIDLGPNGSWNQDGWFGGYDQERWLDEFMYEEGSANTTDRIGRIKLWPGYNQLLGRKTRHETRIRAMTNGGTGSGENTPLLIIEDADYISGTSPSGGYRVYAAQVNAANEHVDNGLSALTAIAPMGNEAGDAVGSYLVGDSQGRLYKWDQAAGTFGVDGTDTLPSPTPDKAVGYGGICAYNGSNFYGRGRFLRRRHYDGDTVTHSTIKAIGFVDQLRALTVWQNRIWFLGIAGGGRTFLFVSDGVTVATVLEMAPGFTGYTMHAHYGSLYIGGAVNATPGYLSTAGQLWRYNGSSLTKLWDGGAVDALGYGVESLCSWGRFVVWGRHGSDELGRRAGVWLYDAEEDAILEGPTLDMDPDATHYAVTAVAEWNNTIAVAFQDMRDFDTFEHPWMVGFVRRDEGVRFKTNANDAIGVWGTDSFGYQPTVWSRSVKSSSFDADLPAVDKLWLTGFIRCKVPADSRLRFAVSVDGGAEVDVTTITANGTDTWRSVAFDLEDGAGSTIRGTAIQYTVYLENLDDSDTETTATPEVDFVGLQFQPAPDKRRIWYMRVVAQDDQERLDESANPLDTRQDIVDKLMEFWRSNDTLYFWEASATGGTPDDADAVKVTLSNFSDTPYRISSTTPEVQSETSFSLLEVPPT